MKIFKEILMKKPIFAIVGIIFAFPFFIISAADAVSDEIYNTAEVYGTAPIVVLADAETDDSEVAVLKFPGNLNFLKLRHNNVDATLYGVVDFGYRWAGRSLQGEKSRWGLDSGIQNGSRIGLQGGVDAGRIRVEFLAEMGLGYDTEHFNAWNRQSYLSLIGDLGTFSFGRQGSALYQYSWDFDPFGDMFDSRMGTTYLMEARMDNLFLYKTPKWGPLSILAGFSHNIRGDEKVGNRDDIMAAIVAPRLDFDRLSIALNLQWLIYQNDQIPAMDGETVFSADLMASYDFSWFKLMGSVGMRNASLFDFSAAAGLPTANGLPGDTFQWLIGAEIPVFCEKGTIILSYINRSTKVWGTGDHARVSQFGAAYLHHLCRNVDLYLSYCYIHNNDVACQALSSDFLHGYQTVACFGAMLKF